MTVQSRTLTQEEADAFGRDLDALRQEVTADLGQRDVDHIRRIIRAAQRSEAAALQTPEATPNEEILYLVNPASGERVPILTLPATTGDRVYWSPDGNKLLYFLEPTLLPDGTPSHVQDQVLIVLGAVAAF